MIAETLITIYIFCDYLSFFYLLVYVYVCDVYVCVYIYMWTCVFLFCFWLVLIRRISSCWCGYYKFVKLTWNKFHYTFHQWSANNNFPRGWLIKFYGFKLVFTKGELHLLPPLCDHWNYHAPRITKVRKVSRTSILHT